MTKDDARPGKASASGPSINRRLAAILAADIAGYSRLMDEDEEATVAALKGHQAVVLPLVSRYGGQVIDTAGDGILAEFASVINATECAVEIQTVMAMRNESVPQHRRMLFRIGINLGDVIHDETRIYGDGINVAARLEGIAEPGGICISRQVFEQVNRTLKANFESLGPRALKNIAQQVDVFAIAPLQRGNAPGVTAPNAADLEQEIHFCTAPDGVQLAYSTIGQGPVLMKTGNWMTHLEYDLESPIWRPLYRELARTTRSPDTTHVATGCPTALSTRSRSMPSSVTWKRWSRPSGSIASHCSAFHRGARSRSPTRFDIQSASRI